MMPNINIINLTRLAKEAAERAGNKILEIYDSNDFEIELKSDNSPLTVADKAAHNEIIYSLEKTGIQVLSEEGADFPYEIRKNWEYFWLIDPLDGTKEFIKKNGEFTVNIALIHKGIPILGVVNAPAIKKLYWGNSEQGSWIQDKKLPPKQLCKPENVQIKTIVASKSHLTKETQDFIDQFENVEVISMGSSLKFMLVAENNAQIYPRFAPTMEWDTAAAHAIILSLGGDVLQYPSLTSMNYNKESLLNPWFLVTL